ncbi:protein of unknown function [Acetoanaerobium sticklandii]|uniref:Flagellar Assembly Protein A N-terminal region domain-containing protein n=1 Tax=Acetoanaerobium sticklandii (strain ATCC 12662 / DSM 519 / JCM 1433 / CCUG 9281 / NCIMB 10654 / HF) TaxID=499177 RepID=E3PSH4_ACESD|nr:FapA family protein [Acetoanaerobium sticklandii]CBH21828.1 protein of unknown function [Acetoanaerobium sticklandii]
MFQRINFDKIIDDYTLNLVVTKDYMKAYLEISLDTDEIPDKNLTIEDIESFLREKEVVYGIQRNIIQDMIDSRVYQKSVMVAEADMPQKGDDGYIQYTHRIKNSISLNQDDKGNINFKELGWFVQVNKGDVLAKKIPPTKGKGGKNLKGEEIPAVSGKEAVFKYGKNVVESEDKTSLISTKEGRLEYAGDKLQVNDVLSIKGNIDTSTGNIHFGGDVVVNGDIKTGFEVNCAGSLEVNGVIEAANIVVGRDLVVKGGIQGNAKSSIKVSGSTICRFIENACVFSDGDIITDFVVHSNISCGSNLVVKGKKGLIVGGEIKVKNEINAQVIGSYMGTKTIIEIGLDPSQKNKLDAYRDELHSNEKKLKDLQPTIETGKQLLQRGLMDNIKKISFVKMLEDYNKTVQNISIVETEIQKIEKQLSEIRYGMMQVKDKIYPGVKITIGRYSRYIKDETGASKLYVQDGDIVIHKN